MIEENRSYLLWKRLMKAGERTGCHQLPERSFFIRGYQFPVCARCTGVLLGYMMGIIFYALYGGNVALSLLGCSVMAIDWSIQALKIKESNQTRRIITGFFGGYGVITIEITFIFWLLKELKPLLERL